MDCALKQSTHQFHKIFFSYLKMFSIQCRKNIAVEDSEKQKTKTKTKLNIANLVNIYTNICTDIICDENDSN